MKIRKYFGFYNIIMLITPIILIGVVSVIFLLLFIMRFPVEEMYVRRTELINPAVLVRAIGAFFAAHPKAVIYVLIWLGLCIAVTAITTTIATKSMSRRIEQSINELTGAVEKIRRGDLSFEIMGSDLDEINKLCIGFDDMKKSLIAANAREAHMNKERIMLIANISHDLKTPITAIRGYIDAINDGLANTPQKLNSYLNIIKSKTKTIENLVSNLSMFSRLELSGMEFSFETGEMNDLLYEIAEDYRATLSEYGIELVTEFCSEDTTVSIDYEKMQRVFVNIIENSIKYKCDDSNSLKIKSVCEGKGVFVYIEDDGIGLDGEELERVFDSFYRADEARTSKIKGNGLGLGIAKQIVEKHGGKIWLKSEGKNKGTTAVVYIPRRKSAKLPKTTQ